MHSEMDVPRPRINNIKTMEQKQEHKNSNIMTSFLISHLPKSSTLTLHQKRNIIYPLECITALFIHLPKSSCSASFDKEEHQNRSGEEGEGKDLPIVIIYFSE